MQVTVLFAGQQIPKSPFEVDVDKAQGDPTKVIAKGPGLEPLGNIANKPTYFDIYTAGALSLYALSVYFVLSCAVLGVYNSCVSSISKSCKDYEAGISFSKTVEGFCDYYSRLNAVTKIPIQVWNVIPVS